LAFGLTILAFASTTRRWPPSCKTLPIHVADPAKQAEASAWLSRESLAYDAVLQDLVRVGVAKDGTQGAGVALA